MQYQNFIGIDIGKNEFVAAILDSNKTEAFDNSYDGWSKLFKSNYEQLTKGLVVLETTGGYEHALLSFLTDRGVAVHRADTRKVKNFIRSYGKKAKTDKIDALELAKYAKERQGTLKIFKPKESVQNDLKSLEERRLDLKQMLVQEKNRAQAPLNNPILCEITEHIVFLEKSLANLSSKIDKIISDNKSFQNKEKILMSIPGIGKITAHSLLCLLPELGHLDRKQIASLCGLAPHPRESGGKIGYRRTWGGRPNLKQILFMAAMGARRTKGSIGLFYEQLIGKGKKKMVALVALMRKIIVIANAKLRDDMRLCDQSELVET